MNTDKTDSVGYHRKAIILIVGALLLRTLYSLVYPVHLAGDEAYYWDWGRRPALGYFSKPPFIAWLYAAVDWIGQGSLFGVRFAAILLGSLSLFVTYLLTRKLFDTKTAFIAVILALAIPGNCLLSFVLTIDAPLVLAWSLALYFLWKFVQNEQAGLSLLGLFFCLGIGHLTKQMMLFFPPLALAFLFSGKETRGLLRKPGLWIAIIGSLVFLIPPYLIWNPKNDWITFQHMSTHVGAHHEESFFAMLYERVETFLEFFLSQLGAISPVIAFLIFVLTVLPLFKPKNVATRLRFLLVFCGVPLLLILIVAMFQKVQPNWPAVVYLAGVPMVAAWFSNAIEWFPVRDKTRTLLFRIGIGLGFALCAFFYLGPVVFSLTGNEGHRADPNRRLIGSDRLATSVQEVRQTVPGWEEHFVVASGHRYQTAWLAFELPDQPMVYRTNSPEAGIESQYELWPGPWEDGLAGKDGILVMPGGRDTLPKHVRKAFERTELLQKIEVKFGAGLREYSIFRGINLQASFK